MNDAEIRLQVQIDDNKANSSIDNLTKKTESLSKAFTNAGKKLTLGLTVPIAGLITSGIKYNAEMEQFQASLSVLLGSTDKAKDLLSYLKEMADTTPFETTDLVDSTKQLLAYGVNLEDAKDALSMLGDVAMGDKERLSSLTLAFGQVQSKGKLAGQELLQMVNVGFNPLQIISEKTGKSMTDLYKDMENGAISADMITEAFKTATSEGGLFYGAMDKQSQTVTGRLSTLKDAFSRATGSLTESLLPALESLVQKLTKVASWFASLDEGQRKTILTILAVVASIGPLLIILSKVITAVTTIASLVTKLGPIFQGVWAVIKVVGVVIGSTFGAIVIAVGSVVGAIIWAIFYIKKNFIAFSTGLNYIFKGILNGLIWVLNQAIKVINVLMAGVLLPFNAIIAGLNIIPGVKIPYLKLAIPKIPSLAVGTDLVNQDGLAYLHKGESVQPASVAGGGYSNRTTSLNIEMGDIYMDSTKVGRAITPVITRTLRLAGAT